ncbi:MAG: isocitrate/isopropylmalate dehydrogenase family protein [Candidatus Bathyarchaeia archaeon]
MARYKIAKLPGDGIGRDVMEAADIVLEALQLDAEYIEGDIGWEFWKREGDALPDRTIELLKETDCALLGAITSKPREEAERELDPALRGRGYSYVSPVVKMRQILNLHTNMRPCKAYPGNPLNYRDGIDIVIFRENTECLYSGVEFHPLPREVFDALSINPAMRKFGKYGLENIALTARILTRQACENIARQAFEYARRHKRRSVTVVDKPNVLRETGWMMVSSARRVARDYPEIPLRETNIDSQCMWLLKDPLDYDVIVASNMFGDILSDLAAQLVGGLGFAPSANIGDDYAVFEPTHGSAPKYAGQYRANPIAMILSVKLMLDWLGEAEMANRLEGAVARVIREGRVRTYDMGGNNTTLEMAREIAKYVKEGEGRDQPV